jgi:hypothetical protein
MLDATAELEIRRAGLTESIDQNQQWVAEAKRRLDAEDGDYSDQEGRSAARTEKRLLHAANYEQALGQLDDDQAERLRVDRTVHYLQERTVTEIARAFYLAGRAAVRANVKRHLALRKFPLPFWLKGCARYDMDQFSTDVYDYCVARGGRGYRDDHFVLLALGRLRPHTTQNKGCADDNMPPTRVNC